MASKDSTTAMSAQPIRLVPASETASPSTSSPEPAQVKVNHGDSSGMKRALDDLVASAVLEAGYQEDHFVSNVKIALGLITCSFALIAQFYPKKYPDNWLVLCVCAACYVISNFALNLFLYTKEGDVFMFTKPKESGQDTAGLCLVSQMPRYSDIYKLEIFPHVKSASTLRNPAVKPMVLSKSVTKYFDEDGVLVAKHLRADLAALLKSYESSRKKLLKSAKKATTMQLSDGPAVEGSAGSKQD